jgi:hypothetical protein
LDTLIFLLSIFIDPCMHRSDGARELVASMKADVDGHVGPLPQRPDLDQLVGQGAPGAPHGVALRNAKRLSREYVRLGRAADFTVLPQHKLRTAYVEFNYNGMKVRFS